MLLLALFAILLATQSAGATNSPNIRLDYSLSDTTRETHSNAASPVEVAYYDATGSPAASDAWSSYWYNGKIYTNDIGRGQDVFDFLTPTNPFGMTVDHLNAQTQEMLLPRFFFSKPAFRRHGALTGHRARQGRLVRAIARELGSPSRRHAR